MTKVSKAHFRAQVSVSGNPETIDFLTSHTHTENGLPLTVSSPYQRTP
jgi:hypothetical protein